MKINKMLFLLILCSAQIASNYVSADDDVKVLRTAYNTWILRAMVESKEIADYHSANSIINDAAKALCKNINIDYARSKINEVLSKISNMNIVALQTEAVKDSQAPNSRYQLVHIVRTAGKNVQMDKLEDQIMGIAKKGASADCIKSMYNTIWTEMIVEPLGGRQH